MKKKILIVDEIRPLAEREKGMLHRQDFEILTSNSSRDAITLHKEKQMDLIIANIDLPEIPGDKLCSMLKLREETRKCSFILLCRKNPEDIERAKKCKASAYIFKPVDKASLTGAVSKLLDVPIRKDYRVLLRVQIEGKTKDEMFFCKSVDLSMSGMLMESEKPMKRGTMINAAFFLSGDERLTVKCEVVREAGTLEGKWRYGVTFREISEQQKEMIDNYIKSHS